MEQGGRCHHASEPEWPQCPIEWGRLCRASRLTMFYRHCAEAQPRRVEVVEVLERRNRSERGLLIGVLMGAGVWAAILAVTNVIKL